MVRMPFVACAALLAASPSVAAAQAADAREVIQRAAEAAAAVTSVRYEAETELTSATSRRLVRGSVAMARFDLTDAVGGKLAVRGESERGGGTVTRFEVVYDGQRVQRYRPEVNKLLQGDAYYGGEALLTGTSRFLVLDELLAGKPYAREQAATSLSYEGRESVAGVECHVVHATLAESDTSVRWHFAVDDALPRRLEHHYLAASGKPVTSILTVKTLEAGVELAPTTFAIEAPAGAEFEQVGRRPPPPLRVGQPTPDFTLQDSEGNTHQLSSLRGRVVLIEFFSTNCPHCERSVPVIQQIKDRYGPRGTTVLAIHCRDGRDADPVGFVRGGGHDYPVLLEGNGVANQYSVRTIPLLLVVGPDGNLVYQQTGFGADSGARLMAIIEQHLPG